MLWEFMIIMERLYQALKPRCPFNDRAEITAGNDGRVLVLTSDCVWVFNIHGVLLFKGFAEASLWCSSFHLTAEHVVFVPTWYPRDHKLVIYTKEGKLLYTIHWSMDVRHLRVKRMTVTTKGRIAMACTDFFHEGEVYVLGAV